MAEVDIYTPTSVALPPELGMKRDVLLKRGERPSYGSETRYDYYTLLYDVFRVQDGNRIMALGPELRNLAPSLLPLKIFHKGKQLEYKTELRGNRGYKYPVKLQFLDIEIPPLLRDKDDIELEFKWRSFSTIVKIRNGLTDVQNEEPNLILTTIQKNNPVEWINDWARYYHREHRVKNIILYDNGSDDVQGLVGALEKLREEIKFTLVHWNFPYGAVNNSFCQQGSLNHSYIKFGRPGVFFLNFDVDEYLINDTRDELNDYLSKLPPQIVSLAIKEIVVPNIPDEGADEKALRVTDFPYRSRQPNLITSKTIYRYGNTEYIGIHYVLPKWPKPFRVLLSSNRLWRLARKFSLKLPGFFFEKFENERYMYFNHYRGLSTGWNPNRQKLVRDSLDLRKYKYDDLGQSILREVLE